MRVWRRCMRITWRLPPVADAPGPQHTPQAGPLVKCPGCGENLRYDAANPFRPFCSERCRMADLGAWASEGYRIPDATPPDGSLPLDAINDDD